MKARMCVSAFCLIVFVVSPQWASGGNTEKKEETVRSIEKRRTELIELSYQIRRFVETALRETQYAKLLADHADQKGFRVERGNGGEAGVLVQHARAEANILPEWFHLRASAI